MRARHFCSPQAAVHFFVPRYLIKPFRSPVLPILTDFFKKKHLSPIPKKLLFYMESYPKNELSTEEWAFLESLEGANSFCISGPIQLKAKEIERFVKLPWLHTVKQLELHLGQIFDLSPCIPYGFNGEFLQKLVDQKAEEFKSFLISYITPEDIVRYLENCLAGSHALRRLVFRSTIEISESDLLPLGFQVETDGEILKAAKIVDCREKKERRRPDRILLEKAGWTVIIRADYDEYRPLGPRELFSLDHRY